LCERNCAKGIVRKKEFAVMNELASSSRKLEQNAAKIASVNKTNDSAADKKSSEEKATLIETSLLFLSIPVLCFGWVIKEKEVFAAELGWGYALGIVGGVMMLVLMFYPLRKHAKFMRNFGQVRHWFRLHMALGILGPIAVLYHANFGLGSINSNVALFSMLIVASSGVIGRFVYSKIHHGLYGRKASFEELHVQLEQAKEKIETLFAISADELMSPLTHFEKKYTSASTHFLIGALHLPFLPFFSMIALAKFKKNVKDELNKPNNNKALSPSQVSQVNITLSKYAKKYLNDTSKMIEFIVYEKIFSLWHMLHLPLFLIMLSTGIFHVYAVHMY